LKKLKEALKMSLKAARLTNLSKILLRTENERLSIIYKYLCLIAEFSFMLKRGSKPYKNIFPG